MKKTVIGVVFILLSVFLYSKIVFNPQTIYVGHEITFSIDNPNGCNSCSWDFGDNTSKILAVADNVSVKHTYTKPGNYSVTFTFGGCPATPNPSSIILLITVLENRTISISPQNPTVHQQVTITLNNALTHSVKWDFGDNSPKPLDKEITKHTYSTTGVYTIIATEKGFLNAPVTRTIAIGPDPRTVDYLPKNPKAGEKIDFTANNFTTATLRWDFGDGTVISSGKTTSHTYNNSGTYTVKVFDNNGQDEYPITFNLTIAKDMRIIRFSPNMPSEGENITFSAQNFKSSAILWDFGDGFRGKGPSKIVHYYKSFGNFEVKAYDNNGNDQNPVKIKIQVMKDMRRLSWEPMTPVDMEPVKFTLSNFNAEHYLWKFGDRKETRTSVPSTSHVYNRPGIYTVRVYDKKGKFAIPVIAKVNVQKDFRKVETLKRNVHVGERFSIKTKGFKSNVLLWDFGDGNKKRGGKEEIYFYKRTGIYTINVKDKNGNDPKIFKLQIQVLPDQRKIELSSNKIGIGEKLTVKAVNFYSKNVLWDFGDGIKKLGSTSENHFYRKEGKYTIKAIDYAGKDDLSFSKTAEVVITRSQASALAISGGEFFFPNNGKSYIVISKEERNFKAKVRIKFEGTGILTAYWKIDDKPFKLVNTPLSFGQFKAFTLKGIPTHSFGIHKISFAFKNPSTKANLYGYYFVSPIKRKIQIITPKDNEIVKNNKIRLKWKQVKGAYSYKIVLSKSVGTLFKKPEKRLYKKVNTHTLKIQNFKKGRYFWFIEAFGKSNEFILCSEINSFILK